MTRTGWRTSRWILATMLGAAGLAAPAAAQDDLDDTVLRELRELKQNQEAILRENEALRREIDEMKAADDAWMTEARAATLRQLVGEVLMDADQRASALEGSYAGWDGNFFLASPDGRFRMELDGQLQLRWLINYHDQPDRWVNGFEFARTKLTLRGHVFNENIRYLLRTDQTRNEPGLVTGLYYVRDAWIAYDLTSDWSVRAGQFKVPFNREELVASQYQLAVERSAVNENVNFGRTQGIELQYAGAVDNVKLSFNEGIADEIGGFGSLVGTQPVNTPWNASTPPLNQASVEWSFSGRWEHLYAGSWEQFKDFTSPATDEYGMLFGVAVHGQQGNSNDAPSGRRNEQRLVAVTGDLSVEWGGANAFLSGTYLYNDQGSFGEIEVTGIVAQVGFYTAPKVEVFGRWEWGYWDFANTDFGVLSLLTFGVNYYIDGHDLKFTADIGYGLEDVDTNWDSGLAGWRQDFRGNAPQILLRTQLQLLF